MRLIQNFSARHWLSAIAVAVSVVLVWMFGIDGLITAMTFIFLMWLPLFLLLKRSGLTLEERVVAAVFAGIVVVSLGSFLLNLLIGSLRMSFLIVAAVLYGAGWSINNRGRKMVQDRALAEDSKMDSSARVDD